MLKRLGSFFFISLTLPSGVEPLELGKTGIEPAEEEVGVAGGGFERSGRVKLAGVARGVSKLGS